MGHEERERERERERDREREREHRGGARDDGAAGNAADKGEEGKKWKRQKRTFDSAAELERLIQGNTPKQSESHELELRTESNYHATSHKSHAACYYCALPCLSCSSVASSASFC